MVTQTIAQSFYSEHTELLNKWLKVLELWLYDLALLLLAACSLSMRHARMLLNVSRGAILQSFPFFIFQYF